MTIEVRTAITLDDLDIHFESRHPDVMPVALYWPHDEHDRTTYYSIRFGPDCTVFLTPAQARALHDSLASWWELDKVGVSDGPPV